MGDHPPDGQGADRDSVMPLDAFPDPVAAYIVRDGEPVVTQHNQAFSSVFTGTSPETPVREWWRSDAVSSTDLTEEEVCHALVGGEAIDGTVVCGTGEEAPTVAGNGRHYRLRSVVESSTDRHHDGYLVLTTASSDSGESVEVDRIASVISHDLRNPLDVAKARLQAARETGEAEHFDHLEQAHDRMERIIQDVLTLARSDGAISPSTSVGLETIVTDAWATVDTETATLSLEDDLPEVRADPDRVQRLFENLFRNSIEHGRTKDTRGGRGHDPESAGEEPIELRVGTTEDGFFVADDGVGVPAEARDRVFNPGYTSNDTGTGLGLTVVEQISTAHDWTVSLVESVDGGARFEFHGLDVSTE